MRLSRATIFGLGLVIACRIAYGQESATSLTKNPFSRPSFMIELQDAPRAAFAGEPVELQLIATLVSNGRSLANIDGEVLGLGDAYEGYRVTWIGEGRVVLVKDGEQTTLDLLETGETDEGRD